MAGNWFFKPGDAGSSPVTSTKTTYYCLLMAGNHLLRVGDAGSSPVNSTKFGWKDEQWCDAGL